VAERNAVESGRGLAARTKPEPPPALPVRTCPPGPALTTGWAAPPLAEIAPTPLPRAEEGALPATGTWPAGGGAPMPRGEGRAAPVPTGPTTGTEGRAYAGAGCAVAGCAWGWPCARVADEEAEADGGRARAALLGLDDTKGA
jgi:hypothetical protein